MFSRSESRSGSKKRGERKRPSYTPPGKCRPFNSGSLPSLKRPPETPRHHAHESLRCEGRRKQGLNPGTEGRPSKYGEDSGVGDSTGRRRPLLRTVPQEPSEVVDGDLRRDGSDESLYGPSDTVVHCGSRWSPGSPGYTPRSHRLGVNGSRGENQKAGVGVEEEQK